MTVCTTSFHLLPSKKIQVYCIMLYCLLRYQAYTRFGAANLAMACDTWPLWTSLWQVGSMELLWNKLGLPLQLGWSALHEAPSLGSAGEEWILDKIREGWVLECSDEVSATGGWGALLLVFSLKIFTQGLDKMFKCYSKCHPYFWCFLLQNR